MAGIMDTHRAPNKSIMEPVQVDKTELCYVTAINLETRTFFAQFCKFSNEELSDFLKNIQEYCEKAIKERKSSHSSSSLLKKLKKGEVVCARYSKDRCWYRATVLSKDSATQSCSVLYADYGNLETILMDNVVQVSPDELPIIKRVPFGVTCFYQGCGTFDKNSSDLFLETLLGNHAMIKVIERQTDLQWKVDIPKHAYNKPIWELYKPGRSSKSVSIGETGQKKNMAA